MGTMSVSEVVLILPFYFRIVSSRTLKPCPPSPWSESQAPIFRVSTDAWMDLGVAALQPKKSLKRGSWNFRPLSGNDEGWRTENS